MTLNLIKSQKYIDGLEDSKFKAGCLLDVAKANLKTAEDGYNNANTWKNVISEYWVRVQKTNELANKLISMECMDNMIDHAKKIGINVSKSKQAIQLLVNAIKLVSDCGDELKSLVQSLQYKIKCLDNLELNATKSKGILKLLDELDAAITEAQTCSCVAIENSLDALEASWNLNVLVNGDIDNYSELEMSGEKGLRRIIEDLKTHIDTGKKPSWIDAKIKPTDDAPNFPLTTDDCDYYDYVEGEASENSTPPGDAIIKCLDAQKTLEEAKKYKRFSTS